MFEFQDDSYVYSYIRTIKVDFVSQLNYFVDILVVQCVEDEALEIFFGFCRKSQLWS
ncbi:hypothetical protein LINPERPRIM_LOCUS23385 [Linum perenne]